MIIKASSVQTTDFQSSKNRRKIFSKLTTSISKATGLQLIFQYEKFTRVEATLVDKTKV